MLTDDSNQHEMKRTLLTLAAGVLLTIGGMSLFAFTPEAPATAKAGQICVVRNTIGSSAWSKILSLIHI